MPSAATSLRRFRRAKPNNVALAVHYKESAIDDLRRSENM
jgi:hypothetical protein